MRFLLQATSTAAGLILILSSCATLPRRTLTGADLASPDYRQSSAWAALPDRPDSADVVAIEGWHDVQATSPVDVFFIHPTSYTGKKGDRYWNAPLADAAVNLRTDKSTMKYQASLFNSVGRVYAPRYRQAHLHCFYAKDKAHAEEAIRLAYADIRSAFTYYLEHFNTGRPFIIASHSQGTLHATRLLQELVDGRPVQAQLIAAYLPGYAVKRDAFDQIPPCRKPTDTGCYCTWRTVKEGFLPKKFHFPDQDIVVTNPITWDADRPTSDRDEHQGAVLLDFERVYSGIIRSSVHQDLLWINKPRFPWSFLFLRRNYHVGDYNFFYVDVRENARLRVSAFFHRDQ